MNKKAEPREGHFAAPAVHTQPASLQRQTEFK